MRPFTGALTPVIEWFPFDCSVEILDEDRMRATIRLGLYDKVRNTSSLCRLFAFFPPFGKKPPHPWSQ